MNDSLTRRAFLSRSLTAAAGSTLGLSAFPHLAAQTGSANNQVRVAVAGIRSQGNGHIGRFQNVPGVTVVGLCDPDRTILEQRVRETTDKYDLQGVW